MLLSQIHAISIPNCGDWLKKIKTIQVMWEKLKNTSHIYVLMNLYALRNKFIDKPVWLSYSKEDVIHKGEILVDRLDIEDHHEVLDVGIGNGVMLEPFVKQTKNIYGIDLLKNNIKQSASRFPEIPRTNFTIGNCVDHLWWDEKKYDVIIISGVLGYMNNNKQIELVSLCKSRLKYNGVLVISGLQLPGDEYIWQTYTQEGVIMYVLSNFECEILNEWDFYGIKKYSSSQRTVFCKVA
jgi:2-polyprenyl-3-methyl-5-hydroxy-6-metoxy-1,4-benzoquinol methylase